MGLDTNPAGVDADIAAVLPATSTPTERIYAIAVDDVRKIHDAKTAAEDARAAAQLAEAKRHNQACEAAMAEQQRLIAQSDPGFAKEDRLFIECVELGVETRKQSMTTTTSRDTVMADVVKDGVWIGYQVYNLIATELKLPQRTVPAGL